MVNKFTAVFEKIYQHYIAYVEELPGANTQGETLEEAHENLRETIELILEAMIPDPKLTAAPFSGARG